MRRESPFRRIEDVVAEAKRRTVSVAVSRLPHPASIGVLALGDATKAKFNLVPYAGGNPTSVAVMNGEADCGALPIAGVVAIGDQMRILGVFNDDNTMGVTRTTRRRSMPYSVPSIPALYSSRSWAIHAEVIEKFPTDSRCSRRRRSRSSTTRRTKRPMRRPAHRSRPSSTATVPSARATPTA